ncbi:unnamed protein product [Caenorhabditis angaria]|uniref:Secreted protein n=1 Tax=Caenorhabditis angaria TaxID=860376 RepID=A0A9P1ILJ3_9PELO|nr:unnamed protein product [Caenorhabditis angaria]
MYSLLLISMILLKFAFSNIFNDLSSYARYQATCDSPDLIKCDDFWHSHVECLKAVTGEFCCVCVEKGSSMRHKSYYEVYN